MPFSANYNHFLILCAIWGAPLLLERGYSSWLVSWILV